jgi:hypothetical protein
VKIAFNNPKYKGKLCLVELRLVAGEKTSVVTMVRVVNLFLKAASPARPTIIYVPLAGLLDH